MGHKGGRKERMNQGREREKIKRKRKVLGRRKKKKRYNLDIDPLTFLKSWARVLVICYKQPSNSKCYIKDNYL